VSALERVDGYWLAPLPARRLATLRILCGAFSVIYLVVRVNVLADFSDVPAARFEPMGMAWVLAHPLPGALIWVLWALCVLAGVGFTLGYRYRLSGPLFGVLFLWVTSYRNSWGMIFHNDNLAVVHAFVLGFSPAAAALAIDARGKPEPAAAAAYGWPVKLLSALTLATYVVAGLAKMRGVGLHWADGNVLRNYIAYDAMRKLQLGSVHSVFGAWVVQYAWPFPVMSSVALLLELGAPVALVRPSIARVWALGAWGFHFGVLISMAIVFPYPLSGVAFAPLLEAERIWRFRRLSGIARWLSGTPDGEEGPA
jgi:hypothetical protein